MTNEIKPTPIKSLDELCQSDKKVVRINGYGLHDEGDLSQYRGSENGMHSFAIQRTNRSFYLLITPEDQLRFGEDGIVTVLGGNYEVIQEDKPKYPDLFENMQKAGLFDFDMGKRK